MKKSVNVTAYYLVTLMLELLKPTSIKLETTYKSLNGYENISVNIFMNKNIDRNI